MAYHGQDFEVEGSSSTRFTTPLKNSVLPRWQRKALEQQQQPQPQSYSSASTPGKSLLSSSSSSSSTTPHADRFIPNRSTMDMEASSYNLLEGLDHLSLDQSTTSSPTHLKYQQDVAAHLFEGAESAKVLAFKNKAPAPRDGYQNHMKVLYTQNHTSKIAKSARHIPQRCVKTLDAPELLDDFYLNLLDWSSVNVLAIALGRAVYLWNAETEAVDQLMELAGEGEHVTSVSWIQEGGYLAVGTSNCELQIWDAETGKKLRTIRNSTSRIGSVSWNEHIISAGSRSGLITNNDVRIASSLVSSFNGHSEEVCGLRWSPDGGLLASGGNDNLVNIWDLRHSQTQAKFSMTHHTSAVKALAWCPWQANLLATGGGTGDRHIRFWNTVDGSCLNAIDTSSQVSSLMWSKEYREIVSSHGFAQNQLSIWKYPTMAKVADLTGHTSRVLSMTISPDGQHVASAGADETVRIWKCFESAAPVKKATKVPFKSSQGVNTSLSIR